jgi:uncharacterized protein YqhQ
MKKIGGQAVIEGVLMLSDTYVNTSVRKGNRIISKKKRLKKKNKFQKSFFIRGIVNLWYMLKLGMESLTWSAEQQGEKQEKISKLEIVFSILLSIVFAVLLFIVAPFYLAKLVSYNKDILFNIIDGLVRVAIFVLYIVIIARMKDIKRVFQYHGAEHKVVNCYESKKKLTVTNIKKFSTLNPRCGTSFLMVVLVISIIIFSLITSSKWYYKLGLRIILIPVIVGVSFEVLKVADKFKHNWFFRMFNKPGLWIQKITTQEPDDKQIEVALHSLKQVL